MSIIFGTDGWRALLEKEINFESICIVAQAFSDYINKHYQSPSVLIGYDNRTYSKDFAHSFAKVLSGNGIKAGISNSIIPTPILSFNVKHLKYSAGVMITASHNPAEYNGVKFKSSFGSPFFTEETKKVEELLFKSTVKQSDENITTLDLIPAYKEQLYKLVDINKICNSKLKFAVDSMGGAGQTIINQLLDSEGIIDSIFGVPKTDFYGRYAEPIEKNLTPLSDFLKDNNKYAFGIANDGDADRIGILLDNGEWLSAQDTILLITDYLINGKGITGNIVKTSSVTDKLRTNFESATRKVFDVQVGFKYIAEKMIQEDIVFGCEESGGYGYKNHIPERDGILSAFILMEMLANSNYTKLSEYVTNKRETFGNIYYDRIDYHFDKPNRTELLPELFSNPPQNICGFAVTNIDSFCSSRGIINGLKFRLAGNPRWLLLRASETEPLVRIYSEAESDDEVKNILEFGKKIVDGI